MYALDGMPLDDPGRRWVLNSKTGLRIVPGRAQTGVQLPGRDGVQPSLGSRFDPGALLISLTLRGKTHAEVMSNLEIMHGVLGQRRKLLPLTHTYGNGQVREALVEVLSATDHEMPFTEFVRLAVQCSVPGSFWRDLATTDTRLPVAASATAAEVTGLAGSTAPVQDALLRIKGGWATVSVEDVVTGDKVTVTTPAAASEYVIIDTAAWTARKVTTDTWSGGTNVITSVVSNRGSGPMLGMEPDFATGAGRIRIRATGTNITGTPEVVVRAKRAFL